MSLGSNLAISKYYFVINIGRHHYFDAFTLDVVKSGILFEIGCEGLGDGWDGLLDAAFCNILLASFKSSVVVPDDFLFWFS